MLKNDILNANLSREGLIIKLGTTPTMEDHAHREERVKIRKMKRENHEPYRKAI